MKMSEYVSVLPDSEHMGKIGAKRLTERHGIPSALGLETGIAVGLWGRTEPSEAHGSHSDRSSLQWLDMLPCLSRPFHIDDDEGSRTAYQGPSPLAPRPRPGSGLLLRVFRGPCLSMLCRV